VVRSGLETGSVTVAIGQRQNRLLTFFQYLKATETCKFKLNALPMSKNIQTWHEALFEHYEQLSPLDQLQIPNASQLINFGTD
jgi:hypothetical protein